MDTDAASAIVMDAPHVAVGAGGHVGFGTSPATTVSARLSAELANSTWSLGLEGRWDLPASAPTTHGTARTSLAGGAFVPCLRAKAIWGCGVVLASRMEADAAEPGGARASDAWLFVGIGARVELHLSLPRQFAVRLTGEFLGHPVMHSLPGDGHALFRTSMVSMSFGPSLVHAF